MRIADVIATQFGNDGELFFCRGWAQPCRGMSKAMPRLVGTVPDRATESSRRTP